MEKKIVYNGTTLQPIGNIIGGWKLKSDLCCEKVNIPNYNHKELYKLARKEHASVDVFYIEGVGCCIPCTGGMFKLSAKFAKHLKKCSEYDRNYKWAREK